VAHIPGTLEIFSLDHCEERTQILIKLYTVDDKNDTAFLLHIFPAPFRTSLEGQKVLPFY